MLNESDRQAIDAANANYRRIDPIVNHLAQGLLREKSWHSMSDVERIVCVRYLAKSSKSEDEFKSRLKNELKCDSAGVCWQEPSDELGNEARMIGEALGGLVSASGAIVVFMAYRPDGSLLQL